MIKTLNQSFSTSTASTGLNSMNSENISLSVDCDEIQKAINFYDLTRKINIFLTTLIIIIGIVGNILAVIVFIQRRFRLKASGVYLLCLAVSDGLFLLTHFFEDTLRTYIDVYLRNNQIQNPFPNCQKSIIQTNLTANSTQSNFLLSLNITDQYETTCRLVNFLRYFLRFVSAYIITIFTIQRAIAIYFPLLQNKFSSTELAWKIVAGLLILATALCLFVPFLFKLNENSNGLQRVIYCDTNKSSPRLYFVITNIYIVLIMFIPITTIIICNSFIIFQICKAGQRRRLMFTGQLVQYLNGSSSTSHNKNSKTFFENQSISFNNNNNSCTYHCVGKSVVFDCNKKIRFDSTNASPSNDGFSARSSTRIRFTSLSKSQRKKLLKFESDSQKVTRMLVVMSLSYAILNLPYFITWCLFYYNQAIRKTLNKLDSFSYSLYLFGSINLTEIFYVLNYGIHFFLYCASGKQFRKQLKFSLMKNKRRNSHI